MGGGTLICTLTSLWMRWSCADGSKGGLCGLRILWQQIISLYACWFPTYEPQRLSFPLAFRHFLSQKNHEDINLFTGAGLSEVLLTESVYDRTSLCVHPITSVIYDNIYQQTFDPPQNLSCKFRELISWTRDMNYTIIETTVDMDLACVDVVILHHCFSRWRLILRGYFSSSGDYT